MNAQFNTFRRALEARQRAGLPTDGFVFDGGQWMPRPASVASRHLAPAEFRHGLPAGVELRSIGAQVRLLSDDEEEDDAPTQIVGYACVWGAVSQDLGGFVETFQRGAFSDTLRNREDVIARYNHDSMLGRTSSGTCTLRDDDVGLKYSILIPDTTVGRDVTESIRRGDLQGSSFCFAMIDDQWDKHGDTMLRTVKKAKLIDVSPVDAPAYLSTNGRLDLRGTPAAAGWEQAARMRKLRIALAESGISDHVPSPAMAAALRRLRLAEAECRL